MIQEGYLKKYMRGDTTQMPGGSRSQGQDASRSQKPKKGRELRKREEDRIVRHTLKTIT